MNLKSHLAQLAASNKRRQLDGTRMGAKSGAKLDGSQAEGIFAASGSRRRSSGAGCARRAKASGPLGSIAGLNWQARLTVILIGTCILFSLFFALEFFIAKLSSSLAQELGSAQPKLACLANNRVAWTRLWAAGNSTRQLEAKESAEASSMQTRSQKKTTTTTTTRSEPDEGRRRSKLGVDFDLVYESELLISEDEQHFALGQRRYPIQAALKLSRLLEAYHSAMPFNPDIWLLSEPEKQMNLLWGNLDLCLRDLESILGKARQLFGTKNGFTQMGAQNYKLLQLLDSFGRPESGTLSGHPFWLGSYLQCQQVGSGGQLAALRLERPERKLETRYCVGKLSLNSWPAEVKLKREVSIKVGLCLPKWCDSLALFKQQLSSSNRSLEFANSMLAQVQSLMLLNFNQTLLGPSDHFSLVDIYCLPLEETRKLSFGAKLLICSILSWLTLCSLCTWLRRKRANSSARSEALISDWVLDSLAVDVNLERFVFARGEQEFGGGGGGREVVNLDVFNSVKHVGCVCVIGAHVFLTYLTLGTSYGHTIERLGKDMRTMLLLSLNNIVDTFFVISGILVAYLVFKRSANGPAKEERRAPRPAGVREQLAWYWRLVAARYFRMAPLYFLVYATSKCLATHLGSGPLWDYATSEHSLRGLCKRESWLWPIGFASNFKPLTHHCVPPAWSMAVDLQLFLLLPLLVGLLRRSKRLAYLLMWALIVSSSLLSFANYKSLLDYVSQADVARLRLHVFTVLIRHAAHAYSQPQNRMGPMLIGLMGGHMLHEHEERARRAAPVSVSVSAAKDRLKPVGAGAGGEAGRVEWPSWMRGARLRWTLLLSLLLMLAPTLVQLRQRARQLLLEQRPAAAGGHWRRPLTLLLALASSTHFDCKLALAGLVLIKPLWSICNCLLLVRLASDLSGSLAARLMSLGCWRTLSKLNYAILLLHFEFIAYEAMSRLALVPTTWTYLLSKFAFAYLGSLLAALPLYVLFELPARRLTSGLLSGCGGGGARGAGPRRRP